MRLDMHFHSTASDWLSTREEIISMAKKKNIEFLALTDHNIVSYGFREEALDSWIFSCQSVEISANNQEHDKSLHLTFYALNISKRVESILSNIIVTKKWLIEKQISILKEHWFHIESYDFYKSIIASWRNTQAVNKFDIANFIFNSHDHNKINAMKVNNWFSIDSELFYQKFLKKWWAKFFDYWVHVKDYELNLDICKIIKDESNGILSIAHPNVSFKNWWILEFEEVLPHYIDAWWVNAIEINTKASKEWIEVILKLKVKYNLYLTFGSDNHWIWLTDKKHCHFWEINPLLTPDIIKESFDEYRWLLGV